RVGDAFRDLVGGDDGQVLEGRGVGEAGVLVAGVGDDGVADRRRAAGGGAAHEGGVVTVEEAGAARGAGSAAVRDHRGGLDVDDVEAVRRRVAHFRVRDQGLQFALDGRVADGGAGVVRVGVASQRFAGPDAVAGL